MKIISQKVIAYGAVIAVIEATNKDELDRGILEVRSGMIRNGGGCAKIKTLESNKYEVTIDSGY